MSFTIVAASPNLFSLMSHLGLSVRNGWKSRKMILTQVDNMANGYHDPIHLAEMKMCEI